MALLLPRPYYLIPVERRRAHLQRLPGPGGLAVTTQPFNPHGSLLHILFLDLCLPHGTTGLAMIGAFLWLTSDIRLIEELNSRPGRALLPAGMFRRDGRISRFSRHSSTRSNP